jgi:hypothetical protein
VEFIQLKFKDITYIRNKLLNEQKGICMICKYPIKENEAVLDHKHKLKNQEIGENGAGLVRGVLCKRCNSLEGVILSKFKRSGVYLKDLPQFLRNLADYLEGDYTMFIHPTETPKKEKFGKLAFNRLKKAYKEKYPKRKELIYPKSGLLTKKWVELLNEFGIQNTIKSKKVKA